MLAVLSSLAIPFCKAEILTPDIGGIDLPKTLPKVDCPVYFFVGKNDIQTSTGITTTYFNTLQAPKKALFLFENSGHQIHKDEPLKLQNTIALLTSSGAPR
jgi:pimeloyl-ACP methyl ester carboxylesterase